MSLSMKQKAYMDLSGHFSTDREDKNDIDVAGGNTYYENMLSYERMMGSTDVKLYLAHVKWSTVTTDDESIMMFGTNLMFNKKFGFTFLYTTESEKGISVPQEENDITRMLVSGTYKFGKNALSLTYANYSEEDNDRDGDASNLSDADKHSMNQIALGLKHNCSKSVQLKFTAAKIKYEEDDTTLAKANDNDATLISFGTQIKF